MEKYILPALFFVLQFLVGILILQAGQKLNSGRLQVAGFLLIITQSILVFYFLSLLDVPKIIPNP